MPTAKTGSVFDTPLDDVEEARLDALAEAEIEAGQGVPHERVTEWLLRRAKGEKASVPTA